MSSSPKKQNVKVLMYHRIIKADEKNATYYDVTAENFRQQLQIIESLNFTPITFKDYQLYQEGKLTLPKKPIILSFDDGHTDMMETAVPILREFNMKAVVFVLGDRNMQYAEWDEKGEMDDSRLMTNEQILDLHAEGFEIGAHSMTHPSLADIDPSKLQGEILGAKYSIESLLDEEIITFAYPYGRVNKQVEAVVAESGFKFGCGVYTGPPRFGANDYDIRRLAITYNTNTFKFLMKVATPYEYVEWLYGKIRNRGRYPGTELSLKEKNTPVREYDFTTTNN